jgi:hypothetical protein
VVEFAGAGVRLDRTNLPDAACVRSAFEKRAARNARTHSAAGLDSDHTRTQTKHVEVVVLDTLARRERVMTERARAPGTLLAATDAPTPLPQTRMPRSARPSMTAVATARAKSG